MLTNHDRIEEGGKYLTPGPWVHLRPRRSERRDVGQAARPALVELRQFCFSGVERLLLDSQSVLPRGIADQVGEFGVVAVVVQLSARPLTFGSEFLGFGRIPNRPRDYLVKPLEQRSLHERHQLVFEHECRRWTASSERDSQATVAPLAVSYGGRHDVATRLTPDEPGEQGRLTLALRGWPPMKCGNGASPEVIVDQWLVGLGIDQRSRPGLAEICPVAQNVAHQPARHTLTAGAAIN